MRVPDIYHTDYLLCIGANPRVSHWTLLATPRDPDVLKRIASDLQIAAAFAGHGLAGFVIKHHLLCHVRIPPKS